MVRGNLDKQYYLSTDTSRHTYKGVLLQIKDKPVSTKFGRKLIGEIQITKFISKKFTDTESRYTTTEREALAVVSGLEEVR
jgi:hypothetical protein